MQTTRPVMLGAQPLAASSASEQFKENFDVVLADTPELVDEALALRYQIYCLERGYEDPNCNPGQRERDEYDTRSVHAVVRHRAGGYAGVVRLVLADAAAPERPFPIEAHCAEQFFAGVPEQIRELPRAQIAEISRFAVMKDFRRRSTEHRFVHGLSPHVAYTDADEDAARTRRAMPQVTVGLFAAIARLSVRENITHWFAVMEPTLLRLVGRFGIRFTEIGPAVQYHGRRVPSLANAFDVVDKIRVSRPDIWDIVTEGGRVVPPAS